MEAIDSIVLTACVLERRCRALLVCDCCTGQQILVCTDHASCFNPGDRVCIEYSGAMTRSLPPQITAWRVTCAHSRS